MANDRNDQSSSKDDAQQSGQSGQRREIGEGMHSLDSTQAPLKAENGEVDWDAKNGRVGKQDADDERSSSNR